jgi:antitoxin component of RelBE/YafQ-DinJ toxin-antitoxin module
MTPPSEKTSSLNFRVDAEVPEMLRQLAEQAGLSMTEYVVTFVRASYKVKFPTKAHAYETAAEKFERELLTAPVHLSQTEVRDAIEKRGIEIAHRVNSSEIEELATVRLDRARRVHDRKHPAESARAEEEDVLRALEAVWAEPGPIRMASGKRVHSALVRLEQVYGR